MNARWLAMLLLVVAVPGLAVADGENYFGVTVQPTTLLGLTYERTWGNCSLGLSFGGATWGQDSGSMYLNPGVSVAYRGKEWALNSDISLDLRGFAAAGLYYYAPDAGHRSQATTAVAGELGLEVRYRVKTFLVVGLSLGQAVAKNLTSGGTWGLVSMPLPGVSVGFLF
jgi:hypothetical protein